MTAWDFDRVRIELCDAMSMGETEGGGIGMVHVQAAEIWLSDDEGRIIRTRKPSTHISFPDRPALLRYLADWIEQNDDPNLSQLVRKIMETPRGQQVTTTS